MATPGTQRAKKKTWECMFARNYQKYLQDQRLVLFKDSFIDEQCCLEILSPQYCITALEAMMQMLGFNL